MEGEEEVAGGSGKVEGSSLSQLSKSVDPVTAGPSTIPSSTLPTHTFPIPHTRRSPLQEARSAVKRKHYDRTDVQVRCRVYVQEQ